MIVLRSLGIGPRLREWKSLILPLNYERCVLQTGVEPVTSASPLYMTV
jgi:hypothetical protein